MAAIDTSGARLERLRFIAALIVEENVYVVCIGEYGAALTLKMDEWIFPSK